MHQAGRLLLPTPEISQPVGQTFIPVRSQPVLSKRKRTRITAACVPCRKKKAKCNGQRPSCSGCLRLDIPCIYETKIGETISAAIKRKHSSLQKEVEDFRALFRFLQTSSLDEAFELLQRLKTSDDLAEVLRFYQQTGFSPSNQQPQVEKPDSRLETVDHDALKNSPIQVPSHPWTTIAGDGYVSELISQYFAYDGQYFFAVIYRDVFLEDMRSCDIKNARFCTPFLVNALCAHQIFTSPRAKMMKSLTRQDLGQRFLDEAKKQFDLECGRGSLPTALALGFLWNVYAYLGTDRAGSMFRYMSFEFLRRLDLETRFKTLREDIAHEAKERRVISQALWGIYILELRISVHYGKLPLLQTPTIPKLFREDDLSPTLSTWNIEVPGQQSIKSIQQPPPVPGLLSRGACSISAILLDLIHSNLDLSRQRGNAEDIANKVQLYANWKALDESLPIPFRHEHNLTPQTCYFNFHMNEVAILILQTLPRDLVLEQDDNDCVKDLIIRHANKIFQVADQHIKYWPVDILLSRALYCSLSTLVPYLGDDSLDKSFTRGCWMLRLCASSFPLFRLLLLSIKGVASGINRKIPVVARPCFDGLELPDTSKDLPLSFVLPEQSDILELADKGGDLSQTGAELSHIISKWSYMSID